MNPIHAKLKIYTYSLTALSIITALLYLLSYRFAFDSALHYFSTSSPLPTIARAVLVLSLLWAASALLFIPKGTMRATPAPYSTASTFASALCGFTFLFFSGRDLITYLRGYDIAVTRRELILFLATTIMGLLAAVYFLTALVPALQKTSLHLLLGFCPPLWAFASLAGLYFDFTHPMNEPAKVSVMLALISVMLALLETLRIGIGTARPRWALVTHYLAMLLCGISGLAGWLICSRVPTLHDYFLRFIFLSAFWLLFLARSFDLTRVQLAPSPTTEAVSPEADESEETE